MKNVRRLPTLLLTLLVAGFLACFVLIAIWHPWSVKNINGLPTEVAPTTAPSNAHR